MPSNKYILIALAVIVFLAVAAGTDRFNFRKNGGHGSTGIIMDRVESARQTAQAWVEEFASTYVFDGLNLEFIENRIGGCDSCFISIFSFESRHGGYGNREGLLITQVITPHIIEVEVEERKVIRVVTDGKYNELTGAFAE